MSERTLAAPPRSRGARVWVLAGLVAAGAVTAAVFAARRPAASPEPAPDLARDATEYLNARNAAPLSGPLQAQLTDPARKSVPTEPHPLLNQTAPGFTLPAADGTTAALADHLARGPAVVVFYYGYSCDHCVAQLFGIQKDLRYFAELNAAVIAVSPDAPEHTRKRYAEYGAFDFPVACDRIARWPPGTGYTARPPATSRSGRRTARSWSGVTDESGGRTPAPSRSPTTSPYSASWPPPRAGC